VLTELGLYKLWGENPQRAWTWARRLVRPFALRLAPSYGYGDDRVPAEGGFVVGANHFSELDPAIVGLHCRRQLYYMAKIELVSVPIVGELLRWTGTFAVRRGEGDRDSIRMARWVVQNGHGLGVFAEGTRQQLGHPGPMHAGAAMFAIQEGVPLVPCGIDTYGWTIRNRRPSCLVWGEPFELDLPRNGKGYKEGTAILQEHVHALWRQAAQAVADGFPETLPDGARRSLPLTVGEQIMPPGLPRWPSEEWAAGPLGPVYRPAS
jgi:1-acyl-sn-glycerol-3-phosphate acyltransferase